MNGCFPTVFPQGNTKCMLAQVPVLTVMSMIMNKNIGENGTWEDMLSVFKGKIWRKKTNFSIVLQTCGKKNYFSGFIDEKLMENDD